MSHINLSLKHNRTLEEARARMAQAVGDVSRRFAAMVHRVAWSDDCNQVILSGAGFEARMRVDAEQFYLTGDLSLLGNLLGGPMEGVLRSIAEKYFPPRLT